jgi:cytochrome c-type biogenesis protein CcmF
MILGMLVTSSNKETISSSTTNGITLPVGIDPQTRQQDNPKENLTLIRNVPATMGAYAVTFINDSAGAETGRKFFNIKFEKKAINETTSKETFILQPDVYMMKDNNMSSNPDTRSYLTKDIFTYISYTINKESAPVDTASFSIKELPIGDTSFYSNGLIILNNVVTNPTERRVNPNSMALMAEITVQTKEGKDYQVKPMIEVEGNNVAFVDDTLFAQNLFVRFAGIGEDNAVKIGVKEADGLIDFVTVKTYIFPYINLVWLGLIIMSMGLMISMVYRSKMSKNTQVILLVLSLAGLMYMFLFANA